MSQLVQRYFRKKDKKMEENEVEKVTKEIAELRNLLRDALTTVWWNNQRGQIDFYELPAELLDEQPPTILTPNEQTKTSFSLLVRDTWARNRRTKIVISR